jgi:hypothetical protein
MPMHGSKTCTPPALEETEAVEYATWPTAMPDIDVEAVEALLVLIKCQFHVPPYQINI